MTTTSTRITISLKPQDYLTLQRVARCQRIPMSRIVAEIVGEMQPTLGVLADVLEQVQSSEAEMRGAVRGIMTEAEGQLLPQLHSVYERMATLRAELAQVVGEVAADADRSRAAAVPSDPNPVTRGSETEEERKTRRKSRGVGR